LENDDKDVAYPESKRNNNHEPDCPLVVSFVSCPKVEYQECELNEHVACKVCYHDGRVDLQDMSRDEGSHNGV
jgi:hypothetical protein